MIYLLMSSTASKFFSALASDGAINEEMLSMGELDKIYGPLREQVNESLKKQDSVMAQVQVYICFSIKEFNPFTPV